MMMNKNEAVKKLANVARISVAYAEDLYDSFFEKPVVPQYVADWYEGNKDEFEINLFQCIGELVECYDKDSSNEFENWLMSKELEVIQTLVNMHQFGYEVESEKEYVIKLKNSPQILLYEEKDEEYYFAEHCGIFSRESHTRKELEDADFGWVFNCPGVEVKEVE